MHSLLLALALAAAPTEPASAEALDLRCFRLMAQLAEDENPRVRALGLTAAQYFLGRIDASAPGAELGEGPGSDEPREPLLRACGEAMGAAGHDFRSIGEPLAPDARPSA